MLRGKRRHDDYILSCKLNPAVGPKTFKYFRKDFRNYGLFNYSDFQLSDSTCIWSKLEKRHFKYLCPKKKKKSPATFTQLFTENKKIKTTLILGYKGQLHSHCGLDWFRASEQGFELISPSHSWPLPIKMKLKQLFCTLQGSRKD